MSISQVLLIADYYSLHMEICAICDMTPFFQHDLFCIVFFYLSCSKCIINLKQLNLFVPLQKQSCVMCQIFFCLFAIYKEKEPDGKLPSIISSYYITRYVLHNTYQSHKCKECCNFSSAT